MRKSYHEKQVDLLARAATALRERDVELFGDLLGESYRLDVATGDDWRDRLPLPRTIRVALYRAHTVWFEFEQLGLPASGDGSFDRAVAASLI